MTTGKRLLRQGSIYTVGAGAQALAAAITLPIVTRLLDPDEYGVVTLGLTLAVVLTPIAGLGLPSAVARLFFRGARDAEGGPETSKQLVMSCVVLSVLCTAVAFLTLPAWTALLEPAGPKPLAIGIALALPMSVIAANTALLQVQERPLPFIAVSMIGAAGAQLTGIVVLLLFHATPVAYLAGYLIASATAALTGIALSRAFREGLASRRILRAALAIGLPTIPHSIAILVLALGDRLIIQAFDGSGEVGRYQVAYALGGLSIMILSAVQNAWVPLTFGAEEHARWSALAQTSALVTRLAALLVGGLALASPLLLRILAPAGYDPEDLDSVVAIVALAGLPWAIYLPMSQVMFWERRTKPLLWVTPSAAVANLILVVILLPPFGLEGAAAATCLAIMLQAALAARAARSMADVPWPWREIALNALLALALVAVAVVLGESDFAIPVRALLIAAIAAGAVATVRREFAVAPASQPG